METALRQLSSFFGKPSRERSAVFIYDIVVLGILVALAWLYFEAPSQWPNLVPTPLRDLPVYCVWFGALGGVVISLKGIYDHASSNWDGDQFDLWHFGRPLSAGIAGGITYLLLLAINSSNGVSMPFALAAAFLMGSQDKRFFNFLYEAARLLVQVPGGDQERASTDTLDQAGIESGKQVIP